MVRATVFHMGKIALTLTLENHEGKVLFARTFQQKGNSNRPFEGGFEVAIKEAMTEILNQIVKSVIHRGVSRKLSSHRRYEVIMHSSFLSNLGQ